MNTNIINTGKLLINTINSIITLRKKFKTSIINNQFNNTNINNSNESIKLEIIDTIDFIYNLFIDNLFCDIKKLNNEQEINKFHLVYNEIFTNNTLHTMQIKKTTINIEQILDTLSYETKNVINNYCYVIVNISCNKITYDSILLHQVYLAKILFSIFFMWIENYDDHKEDIKYFNNIISMTFDCMTDKSHFISVYYKISYLDIKVQKQIIKFLEFTVVKFL